VFSLPLLIYFNPVADFVTTASEVGTECCLLAGVWRTGNHKLAAPIGAGIPTAQGRSVAKLLFKREIHTGHDRPPGQMQTDDQFVTEMNAAGVTE
jgi:hypothetical protein